MLLYLTQNLSIENKAETGYRMRLARIFEALRMDGRTDGWTDGRTDGWMDGRTDGWTDGRTDPLIEMRRRI